MVRPSIRRNEWWIGDKREHLGWIRYVVYNGQPVYACVTRDDWVVAGGDTLPEAAKAFLEWRQKD
jgi:hypothetical protein